MQSWQGSNSKPMEGELIVPLPPAPGQGAVGGSGLAPAPPHPSYRWGPTALGCSSLHRHGSYNTGPAAHCCSSAPSALHGRGGRCSSAPAVLGCSWTPSALSCSSHHGHSSSSSSSRGVPAIPLRANAALTDYAAVAAMTPSGAKSAAPHARVAPRAAPLMPGLGTRAIPPTAAAAPPSPWGA